MANFVKHDLWNYTVTNGSGISDEQVMSILIKVYEMNEIYISMCPEGGKVGDAGDCKPNDCMPSYGLIPDSSCRKLLDLVQKP